MWGLSSAGRASALQAEGHRFEPYRPHFMFEMKKNVFMRMHRGVFCVYDEPSTDLCLHKNLYLEENNCFGIICIYGTLTKNERIAMME